MGVFKEIERADGSGVTTFYRISDVHDTVETDDSEGTATVIDYNQAQNKPSINGVTLVGDKTSEDLGLQPAGDYITNDEADAKFIDEDELEAYNYVNETQLQEAIANIDHFHREIVNALPVTGEDNVLYMVRKQGSGEDIYNEYIWVGRSYSEDGYEFIGTTATDLTNYYQKSEVNALLNNKVDKIDGRGLSEQNYTLGEKTKLAGLHNYDDTELQVKVANLHNYDDTDLQLRVGDLEVKEEADINAIQTIQDALDKKMICIRLVEQGDGWTWMDINGSRLTYNRAQAYLGQENCMLFVEQLENDGKVIPAEYKSETTRTRVIFKDLDSLVHILTLGEEDLLVEDTISTEDGLADFEVENEAVDFGARLDEFYGNTSQEVVAAEAGTEVVDKTISINDVNTDKENYITLKGDTSQANYTGKNKIGIFSPQGYTYSNGLPYGTNSNIIVDSYGLNGMSFHINANSYLQIKLQTIQLEPNTEYIISYNRTNILRGNSPTARRWLYSVSDDNSYSIIYTQNSGDQGDMSYTFTTGSTGKLAVAFGYNNSASGSSSTIKNLMIRPSSITNTDFEPYCGGTVSPNPDYPQIVNNVSGYNRIQIEGKNLFNKFSIIEGKYIDNNGSFITDADNFIGDIISLDRTKSYYIKAGTTQPKRIAYYDKNLTYISRELVSGASGSILTIPSNATYLRLSCYNVDLDTLQLEVGGQGTSYESYAYQEYPVNLGTILPSGYTSVDYIESSGTQYIDTGIQTSNYIKIEAEVVNTFGLQASSTYSGSLLGGRISSTDSNFSYTAGASNDYIGNGTSILTIDKNSNSDLLKITYSNSSINIKCSNYIYTNNNLVSNVTTRKNIYIFAMNNNDVATNNGTYKLYKFKIYDNNILVRNFIPCYNSLNVVGLYDLVSNTFFTNQGTGVFTYGATTTPIELCKIGDCQDKIYKKENKWYIEKQVGKAVLNGTENWSKINLAFQRSDVFPSDGNIYGANANAYSDHFIYHYYPSGITSQIQEGEFGWNSSKLLTIRNDDCADAAAFKSWLANNNVSIYYMLTTPVSREITNSALISQLEALYNATLYEGTTNINTDANDLLPYIDLKYNVVTSAPSPNRESEIKVVKGNNILKVHNKNYIYDAKHNVGTTNTYGGVDYTLNTDGSIYVNGTASSNYNYYLMDEASGLLTLTPGTYTLSGGINQNAWVRLFDGTTYYDTDLHDKTFVLTKTTSFKVCLRVKSGATVQDYFKPMLEKTSAATTFEKYRGQNFPLSLGNIELCKLGNYQDKIYKQNNTWYLHKEIKKLNMADITNWSTNTIGIGQFYRTGFGDSYNIKVDILASNIFEYSDTSWDADYHFGITLLKNLWIRTGRDDLTDENLPSWFASKGAIMYGVLTTPTDTEITDLTLLAQLENLQQITQYKHTYIELIPNTSNEMPEADFTYIRNAVINSSDNILGKDTYWNDEVPTQTDLPSNAQEGEIRIVQDTQNVYIYDGYEWIPFDKGGEIDLSNYLAKDNTTAWIPTGAFNPATKKYVDDSVNGIFVPTKTSQLTNDSNFIGKNSNDLTYYYTKSQTYNKSEVDALIAGGGGGGGNISITVSGDTLVITTQSN